MRGEYGTDWLQRVSLSVLLSVTLLTVLGGGGCSSVPKLTAQDRRSDIEFLAHWARGYHPCVEVNEKYKGTPSYEALLPKYVAWAEQTQSDEEFYQVVSGYFNVIGASGHAYLVPEDYLKWNGVGALFGVVHLGITAGQFERARYWVRLAGTCSTRAHPPFRVMGKDGRYFTDDEWQCDGTAVPKGAEILRVNGMSCSRYLDFVKEDTLLKYDAYPKGWVDRFLMIVDEGPSFQGWQVDFRLPDGHALSAFVPKVKGFPAPAQEKAQRVEPKENCTCVELTDNVGYVRIRSFMGSPLDFVFKRFIRRDRTKIKAFLERSRGKYDKLILDLRDNGGGLPQYYYDDLIAPFLDEPVTWKETVGIKRRYLQDTKPPVLRYLRQDVQRRQMKEEEVDPPPGFDKERWVFYEITRQVTPSHGYDFHGRLYVLINGGCYSATDGYAEAVKRTGLGTLVGRRTGGAGIAYFLPPLVRLPASGMIFRLEADLGVNPDGSFNELVGTPPDIELPPADPPASLTRGGLLQDEWIKRLIAEP